MERLSSKDAEDTDGVSRFIDGKHDQVGKAVMYQSIRIDLEG